MAYQALYRQWRARSFSQIVGQDAIVSILRRQVSSGRIAHAYLFSGTRGTGKTSTAQILSRAVNCLSPRNGDPCGECSICRALEEGASLDIEEIDAASNNGVDEIRALRDKIRYPPQSGKYRVYIVDEVHMLSTSAFNALLKTLEEPPPHSVLILATTEPQRLPATILSRCQRFDFKHIPASEIALRLREAAEKDGATYEADALMTIARAADGSMRDGLSLLDVCIAVNGHITLDTAEIAIGTAGRVFLSTVADALAQSNIGAVFSQLDSAIRNGRDAAVLARDLCEYLRSMIVSLVMSEDQVASVLEISCDEVALIRRQAGMMGTERAMRALDILSRVEPEMRWAAHPRVLLELALARCCRPETEADLAALLQRVEALEQTIVHGVAPESTISRQSAFENENVDTSKVGHSAHYIEMSPTRRPSPTIPQASNAIADDGSLWKNALEIIRKVRMPLYAALKRARFLGVREGTAQVSFAPEGQVFYDMLRLEQNTLALKEALTHAAGMPLAVQVILDGEAPIEDLKTTVSQNPVQEPWVQEAINLFGRDKVDIIEDGAKNKD